MKIVPNSIGNYSPNYLREVQAKEVKAKAEAREASAVALPGNKPASEKITGEELKFFTNLYPENKSEIIDYHFYQKSGRMSGVSVGSLFDKRG